MQFSEYDPATGQITRHLVCGPGDLPGQLQPGMDAVPGHHDPRKARVQAGCVTPSREIAAEISYARRRAAEYPPIADQLDAYWKGGAEAEAMRARVLAVKARFPKPAAPDRNKDPAP